MCGSFVSFLNYAPINSSVNEMKYSAANNFAKKLQFYHSDDVIMTDYFENPSLLLCFCFSTVGSFDIITTEQERVEQMSKKTRTLHSKFEAFHIRF